MDTVAWSRGLLAISQRPVPFNDSLMSPVVIFLEVFLKRRNPTPSFCPCDDLRHTPWKGNQLFWAI